MSIYSRKMPKQGFTLVEVLMVVLIISVLAGMVLAVTKYATEKAAVSQAETQLHRLAMLIEEYKLEEGVYPGTYSIWTKVVDPSFYNALPTDYQDRLDTIGTNDPWRGTFEVKIPDAQGYLMRVRSLGEDRLGHETETDASNDDNLEVQ